ncbi:MAG: hypothetical protein JHD28_00995, partial [Bacteroidia bacterium]|nr:hypothetical protein [Bacteroidia bacterium]
MSNKVIIGDEPEIKEDKKPGTPKIEGAFKRLSDIDFKLVPNQLIGLVPFILFCFGLIIILIW